MGGIFGVGLVFFSVLLNLRLKERKSGLEQVKEIEVFKHFERFD